MFLNNANHNYFNTSWGSSDLPGNPGPDNFNGAVKDMATARLQHEYAANAYISAFLFEYVDHNAKGIIIPAKPYYGEYFSRAADHLRPPGIHAGVAYNQFLGGTAPTVGRNIIQDFQTGGAHRTDLSGIAGYTQATWAGVETWSVSAPAVHQDYAGATSQNFSDLGAITLRIAQEYGTPSKPGNTRPLAFTLRLVDAGNHEVYINSAALAIVNAPIDRGAAGSNVSDPTSSPNAYNKSNFVTLRFPLSILTLDGALFDITHVASIGLVFDQRTEGTIAIDDVGGDR